jgi:hypothetical protein
MAGQSEVASHDAGSISLASNPHPATQGRVAIHEVTGAMQSPTAQPGRPPCLRLPTKNGWLDAFSFAPSVRLPDNLCLNPLCPI